MCVNVSPCISRGCAAVNDPAVCSEGVYSMGFQHGFALVLDESLD